MPRVTILRSLGASAVLVLALAACASQPPAPRAFGPLEPWAEPIADALAVGEARFPDGFRRSVNTLAMFDGRLWIGYGDMTANLGSATPMEFRWFASAEDPEPRAAPVLAEGQGAPQRSPTDTGEEEIGFFRIIDHRLVQPGRDSTDDDEAWTQARDPRRLIEGNVFRLHLQGGEPVWRKFRSVPGGEHVHDVAGFDGDVYAVGSGADDRAEWEAGRVFRYLWVSTDGGETFEVLHRVMVPEPGWGDTRYRHLLPVGDRLYAFGYIDPRTGGADIEGRHVYLQGDQLYELDGPAAEAYVVRTLRLADGIGLVVTRAPDDAGLAIARTTKTTRAWQADETGLTELAGWSGRRVLDVAGLANGEALLLSGDGADPERFAVHRFTRKAPDTLTHVLDVSGVSPTALAVFDGCLFLGTQDGRVLRARGLAP